MAGTYLPTSSYSSPVHRNIVGTGYLDNQGSSIYMSEPTRQIGSRADSGGRTYVHMYISRGPVPVSRVVLTSSKHMYLQQLPRGPPDRHALLGNPGECTYCHASQST